MFKIIILVIVAAIAGVLIYAGMRPDTFRVERSAIIKAPPERVYALISDLRGWAAWSPYEIKDPAMKRTHSGAAQGKGAIYEWDGNKDVGKGRMEITEVAPPTRIVIKLDFLKPFEGHNTAEFIMMPLGSQAKPATKVTWAMHGPSPYLTKLIGVFMDMDKMIGTDFAVGLDNLRAVAETPSALPAVVSAPSPDTAAAPETQVAPVAPVQ